MSKFVLKDCKDGLKVKSFKSLEKAKNYVRENLMRDKVCILQ